MPILPKIKQLFDKLLVKATTLSDMKSLYQKIIYIKDKYNLKQEDIDRYFDEKINLLSPCKQNELPRRLRSKKTGRGKKRIKRSRKRKKCKKKSRRIKRVFKGGCFGSACSRFFTWARRRTCPNAEDRRYLEIEELWRQSNEQWHQLQLDLRALDTMNPADYSINDNDLREMMMELEATRCTYRDPTCVKKNGVISLEPITETDNYVRVGPRVQENYNPDNCYLVENLRRALQERSVIPHSRVPFTLQDLQNCMQ